MAENSARAGGVSFCGLLAIVFIVLKLCNVITWSWGWVLAPLWAPLATAVLCYVIVAAVASAAQKRKEER